MTKSRSISLILHVDDQKPGMLLMEKAFRSCGCDFPILWLEDGQKAIDYLLGSGKYAGQAQPQLPTMILLDLKMPVLDGIDVLKIIRNNTRLKLIPVVILSSSINDDDVTMAYDAGANAFVGKPMNYPGFQEVARSFKEFWFTQNLFPTVVA